MRSQPARHTCPRPQASRAGVLLQGASHPTVPHPILGSLLASTGSQTSPGVLSLSLAPSAAQPRTYFPQHASFPLHPQALSILPAAPESSTPSLDRPMLLGPPPPIPSLSSPEFHPLCPPALSPLRSPHHRTPRGGGRAALANLSFPREHFHVSAFLMVQDQEVLSLPRIETSRKLLLPPPPTGSRNILSPGRSCLPACLWPFGPSFDFFFFLSRYKIFLD